MRKKIKQYTAVLLTVTMSLPGTMVYGNVDSLDAASGVVDASGYLKASTSNAQQTIHIASPSDADADEDEEELIDDRKKASPSDAEFDEEDVFAKIYDFIWQDPEEYLSDGRLELSATAEEQPTFEQIVSILPQSILAKTGETPENTSADEAEDITADYDVEIKVSGWQCEDYIQNEDGMWPTSGTFTFSAEPEDGYELTDSCAPLAVEVAVSDEAAMLAANAEIYMVFSRRKDNTSTKSVTVNSDGTNLSGDYAQYLDGDSRIYREGDAFVLELNDYNPKVETCLDIRKGKWIIELNGTSVFDGTMMPKDFASYGLEIWSDTDVTFIGSGTLNVKGDKSGISIGKKAEVSINLEQDGKINATSPYSVNESGYNRHGIESYGKLTIKSGAVTANGPYSGLYQSGGTLNITGGTLKTKVRGGNDSSRGLYFCRESDCSLGGIIETDGLTLDNATGSISGKVTVNHLSLINISESLLTIKSDGILNIKESIRLDNGKNMLVNYGELRVDMTSDSYKPDYSRYQNYGSVIGKQAENWKTPSSLQAVKGTSETNREKVNENENFDVSTLFNSSSIDSEEGAVSYYYVNQADSDKKEQSLSLSTTQFAGGNYLIGARTGGNEKYKVGNAIAYIYVNSADFSVVGIDFVYTGHEQELFKVYTPNDQKYSVEYRTYQKTNKGWRATDLWSSKCPSATSYNDNDLYYLLEGSRRFGVKITSENGEVKYQVIPGEARDEDLPYVKNAIGKSLNSPDIQIVVDKDKFIYDGTVKKPTITIIDTVTNTEVGNCGRSYIDVNGRPADNPIEAGTYKVHIFAINKDYTGDRYVTFTIEKQKLTPVAVISNPSKTYDGTTAFASGQTITLTLQDEDGKTVSDGVSASYKTAAYESKDVGSNSIQITGISLTGDNADKYDLSAETLSISGNIDQASAENLVSNVTYPGNNKEIEYENRDTALPTVTVSSNISGDQVGSYVVSYSATQEGSYVSDLKGVMQNLNVQETEQTIYYRITTQNYEPATGNFTVKIIPSSLNGKGIVVTGYDGEYDGTPHTISVTLPASVPSETEIKYKGSAESEWSQNPPSYMDAGEYTVDYKISCPNYKDLEGRQTVHIRPKSLIVTAGLKNPKRGVIYGDPLPEFEASYTGFVNNETKETALTGTPVMTCSSYTPESGAGTKHTIKVEAGSGGGALSARNYDLTFTPGSFTVGKKQATIQVTNYNEWKAYTYDGKSPEMKAAVEGDGERTVKVEIYAGNPASGSALAEIPKNVGTYTAKFTAEATANYGAAEISLPFDIVQRGLKVTAVDQSITYGDPAPQYTAVYEGFVAGESLENLKGTLSFKCAYQQAKAGQRSENSNAGTYTITPAVEGLHNYKVTSVAGTLTVGKKAPTFTDSASWKEKYMDGSRVYDGTVVNITPSTDGDGAISYIVKNTETGEILKTDPVNVGTYKATYSVAEGTNYQAGSISYEFAITEAGMKNVTANGYDGIYDGYSHGIEVSVQDKLVKDKVVKYGLEPDNYTGTDAPELIDAGTYTVYYQITAPNYKPYTGSAIVTIKQKEIQVVTADQETTYLEEAPKFTVDSVNGMVREETLENQNAVLSFVTAYTKGDDAGEYAVQAVVDGLKNYKVEVVPGTLKVQRRTPVFTDSANLYEARVYDGKAVDLTPTTDGDGQMSRVITNRETNEILTSDPVDVGEYRVVYSVSEGKNYTEGSVSYDFAITQAPLVITAEDKKVTFGSKAPEYTVVYDGFVNGETEAVLTGTLVVTCDYTVESRESAYEIVPSGLSAKNYAIAWKNGVLTARYPESDNDDYEKTSKPANSNMPKSGQGATVKDAQKGYVNEHSGIVSGNTLTEEMLKNNSESLNDGYSHWIKTNTGWLFRYADGTYPKAAGTANAGSGNSSAAQSHEWVQIDGNWWAFDTDGYLATGWIFDPVYKNWFYMDVNTGMKTGWVLIDGKWYYFNPVSDGTKGIMFANRMTPDGWFVREDGSWDEKR